MRRISANYIFPITSDPIRNGYVDFADDGTVTGIGQMSGTRSTPCGSQPRRKSARKP